MSSDHGFTLLETLVVLSILSTIWILGIILPSTVLDEVRSKQFFSTFQNDVLYMQQLTITNNDNVYMSISPETNTYEIKQRGIGKVLIRREIPNNWIVKLNTLSMPLYFSFKGTVQNPGMFSIETTTKKYYVYFPFGKGRSYVVEQP